MVDSWWVAFGATAICFGSGWQCVAALPRELDRLSSYRAAFNSLSAERKDEVRASIPAWRWKSRARAVKLAQMEVREVLSDDERKLDKAYDRQGTGWALILVGAVFVASGAWMAVFQ